MFKTRIAWRSRAFSKQIEQKVNVQNSRSGVWVVVVIICIYAGLVGRSLSLHHAAPVANTVRPAPEVEPQPSRADQWVAFAPKQDVSRRGEVMCGLVSETGSITSTRVLIPIDGSTIKDISPGVEPDAFWVTSTLFDEHIVVKYARASNSGVSCFMVSAQDNGAVIMISAASCDRGRKLLLIWERSIRLDGASSSEIRASLIDHGYGGMPHEVWQLQLLHDANQVNAAMGKVQIFDSWAVVGRSGNKPELMCISLPEKDPEIMRFPLVVYPDLLERVAGEELIAVIGNAEPGIGVQLVAFRDSTPRSVTQPTFVSTQHGSLLNAVMSRRQGKLQLSLVRRGASSYEQYEIPE